MKRITTLLYLLLLTTAAALAGAPLDERDAQWLRDLPDTLSERAGADAGQAAILHDSMTPENADFLRQTEQRADDFRRTAPDDFFQRLKKNTPTSPSDEDSAFLSSLTERQQAALARLENRGKGERQPEGQAFYFLSFSLPDEALGRMIDQASRYDIPATIRGLVENNMQKTTEKMFDLVKQNNRGGLSIDPEAFSRYDIRAVPALVVRCDNTFDVVYGDISLKGLLEKVSEGGDCRQTAKTLLARETDHD